VLVAGVSLHCSCRLCSAIANTLVKQVDALNMGAVVTDEHDTLCVFADFVHKSRLTRYTRCAVMCRIEQIEIIAQCVVSIERG
jgi:hypothetical protein